MNIHVVNELPAADDAEAFACYVYKVKFHHEIRQCLLKWEFFKATDHSEFDGLDIRGHKISQFGIDTPPESVYDLAIGPDLALYRPVRYWWDGKPKPVDKHKCDFDPRLLGGF